MKQSKIEKTLKQAIKYYKRGQHLLAESKLKWVLERDENNETAKRFLSLLNLDSDNLGENTLLEIIEYDKDNLAAYKALADLYWPKQLEKCRQMLKEIIRLEKDEIYLMEAKEDLANVLERLGELDESIKIYEELSAEDPDFHDYYWRIGNILLKKGNKENAVKMLNIALEKARKMQEDDPDCIDPEIFEMLNEDLKKAEKAL